MLQNIVIILDITDSFDSNLGERSFFDRRKECTTRIIERKIMSLEEVSLGIILLGSNKKTDVEILNELEKPSWKMIRSLPNVPAQSKGNLYAALNAANSLLVKKSLKGKMFEHRIILINNLKESSNIDMTELEEILTTLKNNNIQIDVIGCETDLASKIAEATNGLSTSIDVAMNEFIFYQKKYVKGRPWKIELTFGLNRIPVEIFKKNIDESALKEWENINKSTSIDSKEKSVHKKTKYFNSENENLNSKELIQAYSYGKKVIPITKLDKSSIYKSGPESLVIYGFTPSSNISWENLNDNSMSYVLGQNGNKNAKITIKYIAHCLHELNLVGIAKGVRRKDQSPRMYALMPVFDINNFACLSMASICYKEEIKHMTFPQISNKINCSAEQVEAFKDLITAMDLTDVNDNEAFITGQTPSPSDQRSVECVIYRAKKPGLHLPQPNNDILSLFEVPSVLQNRAKDSLEKLQSLFNLKIVKKEEDNGSNMDNKSVPMEITSSSNMQDNGRKIHSIGTINPIDDYKMSLERGKLLNDLAQEMIDAIESLIYSNLNEHCTKALDALRFFRLECMNSDPSYYNNWIKTFKLDLTVCGKNDIIELIQKNNMDLILKTENVLSDVHCKEFEREQMVMETDFIPLKVSSELDDMFD